MHDSPQHDLAQLRSQLETVQSELSSLHRSRRRTRTALLALAGVLGAGWAATAVGADFVCGTLPLNMACFVEGSPAIARQVNGNFKTLADLSLNLADAGVQTNLNLASTNGNLAALAARVTNLEWTVNGDGGVIGNPSQRTGLVNRERVLSGSFGGGIGGCGQSISNPCSHNFNGYFTQTPRCVATARTPDGSGYSENVVMVGVSQTGVSFWEGQYVGGVNLVVDWVCVGI